LIIGPLSSQDREARPELFAPFALLLLQEYISHSRSHIPAAAEFGALEDIFRLLLLLLLLLNGALLLAAHGLLVVVLLSELFGEAVVGRRVCAGGGRRGGRW
jgi:hypothetical protein